MRQHSTSLRIPFSKKNPPSAYNASKNPWSIDYNMQQAEIKKQMDTLETLIRAFMPKYSKQIIRGIEECFG
jgi:hypothetical protein